MTTEIQLGVFVLLNVVAAAGFFVTVKFGFGIVLLISFVLFAGMAVWFIGGETTVVQTKLIPAQNATSTTIQYDGNGNLVSNSTQSARLPSTYEKQVWINSDQNTIGWIYFLAAGVSLTWFLRIILSMFRSRNRIVASGYWER